MEISPKKITVDVRGEILELKNTIPSSAINAVQDVATYPRILLVDDHLESVCQMRLFLQAHGYHVMTAESVQTALQAATQEGFDYPPIRRCAHSPTTWE